MKVKGLKIKKFYAMWLRELCQMKLSIVLKTRLGALYRKWLSYDLLNIWNDLISEASLRKRGWFDPNGVNEIRRLSQTGNLDLYMLQWAIITVELWGR